MLVKATWYQNPRNKDLMIKYNYLNFTIIVSLKRKEDFGEDDTEKEEVAAEHKINTRKNFFPSIYPFFSCYFFLLSSPYLLRLTMIQMKTLKFTFSITAIFPMIVPPSLQ